MFYFIILFKRKKIMQSTINSLEVILKKLAEYFKSDIISYSGVILPFDNGKGDQISYFEYIEQLEKMTLNQPQKDRLIILLTTTGGSVEKVEKLVYITRHHYKEIYFIIPHCAMSAGTLWALSANKIYMDYSSFLGPIDPQINRNSYNKLYPALGILDKYYELDKKSKNTNLSHADKLLLDKIDLADLRVYEQSRLLSMSLLQEWLNKYNLSSVMGETKKKLVSDISISLTNHVKWKSHARTISLDSLKDLQIDIHDYSKDEFLRPLLRKYNREIISVRQTNSPLTEIHSLEYKTPI